MGYRVAARGAAMEMMRIMGNSGSAILSKIDVSIGKSPISRVTSQIMLIYGVPMLLRCAFILIPLIKEKLKTIFEQQNKEKQKNKQEDVLTQKRELGDSQQLLLLSQVEQEQSFQDKLTDLSATMKCAKSNLMNHINQASRKEQAELKDLANRRDQTIMEDLEYTRKLAEDTMQLAEESMKAKSVAILAMEAALTDTRTLKQCEQDFLYDVSSGMHMELYRTSVFVQAQLRNIERRQSMMHDVESTTALELTKVSVQTQLSQIEEVRKSLVDKINGLVDHHQTIFEQQNKEKQKNMP